MKASGTVIVLYVVTLVVAIVAFDVLFFRHQFLRRLLVNIAIALVVAVLYLAFVKHR